MTVSNFLQVIDISPYTNPKAPGDKARVIEQVRNACRRYGFFQVKGHGIPLATQQGVIKSSQEVFKLPQDIKNSMSMYRNVVRRGYEQSGSSIRDGDKVADTKESFFVGREESEIEEPGWHGPNVWPDPDILSEDKFRTPVWEYYEATHKLGHTIWEILLEGLGYTSTEDIMARLSRKAVVTMKMIRSPPAEKNPSGPVRHATGAHTDFGGVTCLLQQPGKDGLEVLSEDLGWVEVPALEDTFVINVGDMVQKWSGGEYKSARHRVVNKSGTDRISCATFWLGDIHIANPLNAEMASGEETVGEQLYERFKRQYGLWSVMDPADVSAAMKNSGDTCVVQ